MGKYQCLESNLFLCSQFYGPSARSRSELHSAELRCLRGLQKSVLSCNDTGYYIVKQPAQEEGLYGRVHLQTQCTILHRLPIRASLASSSLPYFLSDLADLNKNTRGMDFAYGICTDLYMYVDKKNINLLCIGQPTHPTFCSSCYFYTEW